MSVSNYYKQLDKPMSNRLARFAATREASPEVSIDIAQLQSRIAELEKAEITQLVDPQLLDRSPYQPRKHFDPIKMAQLTASVDAWGVLENVIVRLVVAGRYELVAGERRQLAAIAAKRQVPIKVMELSDRDARRIALAENLNRVNLNPIEETWAILNLLAVDLEIDSTDEVKSVLYSLANVAKGVKSRENVSPKFDEQQTIVERILTEYGIKLLSFVKIKLPLIKLPDNVSDAIAAGLDHTKALAIAKVSDTAARDDLLRAAIEGGMPLTEIKKQVKSLQPQIEPQLPSPQLRVKNTITRVVTAKVWEHPDKWLEVQSLLERLEALCGEK
jgi:ParB family transcriptional regulator, chromosome partitioning protein